MWTNGISCDVASSTLYTFNLFRSWDIYECLSRQSFHVDLTFYHRFLHYACWSWRVKQLQMTERAPYSLIYHCCVRPVVYPKHISSASDVCFPNPCLNGEHCVVGKGDTYTCSCLPDFTGDYCQTFRCAIRRVVYRFVIRGNIIMSR